uniref:Uncharacterized protein n=1 Tax=Aegilops tauschii subsp. strangulata TaxID=200361 RepID=A0A453BKR8_AEGTS
SPCCSSTFLLVLTVLLLFFFPSLFAALPSPNPQTAAPLSYTPAAVLILLSFCTTSALQSISLLLLHLSSCPNSTAALLLFP